MERTILVAHGSRKKGAIDMDYVATMLHNIMHPLCEDHCVKYAFLQFNEPDLESTIRECIREGASTVIIHPFFLSSGIHVTHDIPEVVERLKGANPHVQFVCTEPLGNHELILKAAIARIKEAKATTGPDIERLSMELIEQEADLKAFSDIELPVVKRVIHATADPEVGHSMVFHPSAIKAGLTAIKQGKRILTDVSMVRAGINKNHLSSFGCELLCAMDFVGPDIPTQGTRSEAGIEMAARQCPNIGILVVGNAPTALLKAMELIDSGLLNVDLLIGVPVGFVKALDAKVLLCKKPYPFITNLSRKGGSPVGAAIVNALLKLVNREEA